MIRWIRDVSTAVPQQYGNVLLFNTLTGLRPDEAQKSIYLIKTKGGQYDDLDRRTLKHYQFPDPFIRHTKNAYISGVITRTSWKWQMTPRVRNYYYSLRKRLGMATSFNMNMYYCRKVFATHLRNSGIEPEIIDLLQGRISGSVFVNHYYRPDINEIITNKIRPVLDSLLKELS